MTCALLVAFILAITVFVMAFGDGDEAIAPPAIIADVASDESGHQTSPSPATDRHAATITAAGLDTADGRTTTAFRCPADYKCGNGTVSISRSE